jgi:DNA-binding CsgD family transcriptional regulator
MDQPALLERSEELGTLHELVAEMAATRRGGVIIVSGEAGIGKTALLRQFQGELPQRVTSLWGRCDPLFTPRPLGPLLEPAALLGGEPAELLAADAKPFDIAVAFADTLGAITPGVLIIEDVHWADEATLDVLRVLARRAVGAGLLLVISYRSDQLHRDHPLRMMLGELSTADAAVRLELRRLSREAVAELAAGSTLDTDELYERTAGNAFFVTETLAAATEDVPESISDAVYARIAGLSPDARALLDAVAVVPQRAEVWLLEAMTDGDLAALDECLHSGVLRAEADGVMFRHELARLAIEGSLAPHRAIALHRRALAALSDPALGGPDYVRLAHHAEAAGDGPAVLRYAPAAGERAAERGSPREAQHHYWRALRFAEGIDPLLRADLLERFCDHAYLSDMRSEAVDAIDEAVEIHRRRGDLLREGSALHMRCRLLGCIGRAHEAFDTAQDAVRVLEQVEPSPALARAYCTFAGLWGLFEDKSKMIEWGSKAIAFAEQVDDTTALVRALCVVAIAEMMSERPGGQAKFERALELARQARLGTDAGNTYINFTCALIWGGRWLEAMPLIERGIEYTSKLGLEAWLKCLLGERALAELALGRWDDAATTAHALLDGPRDQIIEPRTYALLTVGLLRARRGDPGCWPLLDEAWERAQRADDLQFVGPVAVARAEAAWLEGRSDAIDGLTEHAYDLACSRSEARYAGELAVWRRRAGLPAEPPGGVPERFRLQLDGEPEAAAELLEADGALYDAAIALTASSDGPSLRTAHERLRALGANPGAAIVARRLRELGERSLPRGPREATRENPAGLTNRELEVLPLLAQGLRNAEIAERLVVSPKTVDHHVSAILRKLGVNGRGQAAAAAAKLGVAADEP